MERQRTKKQKKDGGVKWDQIPLTTIGSNHHHLKQMKVAFKAVANEKPNKMVNKECMEDQINMSAKRRAMQEFEKELKEQCEDKGVPYPYQTFMSLPILGRFVNMTRPGKLKKNESKIIILM